MITLAPAAQPPPDPQKAAMAMYEYRLQPTKPTFGRQKVEAIPHAIGFPGAEPAAFKSLSTDEKFTYVMLYGESFSQGCAMIRSDWLGEHRIFSRPAEFLPSGEEEFWSSRETDFLHKNRTRVIELLRETIHDKNRVGANLKLAIDEIHAEELIPEMLAVFDRDQKDLDMLSLCMTLMRDGKYQPFLQTSAYHRLYGTKSFERSYLQANNVNFQAIESLSRAYYGSRMR